MNDKKMKLESDLLVFRNEDANQVDYLAYLDTPLTQEQMEEVKTAIREFESSFPKKDYLVELPLPKMLSEPEIKRLKSGKRTELVFKCANLITQLQD
jgi:hypothetical protein